MVQSALPLPATVVVHDGDEFVPATALRLTGHDASLVLERAVGATRLVELHLAWPDGAHTRLDATVRRVGADGCLADLDVHGVSGDWRPFLDWLGSSRLS